MPLAAPPGEGVEERFLPGRVEGGAVVVFAGGQGVFAPVDPCPAVVEVEVEYGFEMRPYPWCAQDLEADGLGRDVGLRLPDFDEA